MNSASSGRVEQIDDRIREARELVKRFNDRPSRNGASLVERYLQGDLKLAIRRVNVGGRYDGIILEARPYPNDFQAGFDSAGRDDHPLRCCADSDQSAMLPRVVDVVESDENVIIPSAPRLQTFYDGPIGIGKPLYLFTSRVASYEEIVAAGADGKLSVFWTRVAVARSEDINKHVQTTADAVNDCPDLSIENTLGHFDIAEAKEFLSHFRARFFGNTIGAFITLGFKSRSEMFELGYGPINACLSI